MSDESRARDNDLVQRLIKTWCVDPLDDDAVEQWVARFQAESALTNREAEWLVRWLGTQQSQSEIADELGIAPSTATELKQRTFESLAEVDRTTALLATLRENVRPADGELVPTELRAHTAIKLGSLLDEQFSADQVLFDAEELLELLRDEEYREGGVYVLDEGGEPVDLDD